MKELNSPRRVITDATTRLSRSHATWTPYDSCESSRSVSGTVGVVWFVIEEHFAAPAMERVPPLTLPTHPEERKW